MVERRAGGVVEGEAVEVAGQGLIGGVGFDEEAVKGDVAEGLALGALCVRGRSSPGGKSRAPSLASSGTSSTGPAKGMEEKARGGAGFAAQGFEEQAPGLETMDADGEIAPGGEAELGKEDFELGGGVVALDPSVKTNFSDGGRDLV